MNWTRLKNAMHVDSPPAGWSPWRPRTGSWWGEASCPAWRGPWWGCSPSCSAASACWTWPGRPRLRRGKLLHNAHSEQRGQVSSNKISTSQIVPILPINLKYFQWMCKIFSLGADWWICTKAWSKNLVIFSAPPLLPTLILPSICTVETHSRMSLE